MERNEEIKISTLRMVVSN